MDEPGDVEHAPQVRGLVVAGIVRTVAYGADVPEPVAGATVELRLHGENGVRVLDAVTTTRDGRFGVAVPDVAADSIDRVDGFAWAAGFRGDDASGSVSASESGNNVDLTFDLDCAGGAVCGRVVDAEGAPLQDVDVLLLRPGDSDHDEAEHRQTDSDGTYRLAPGWVGPATVCARKEGLGAATPVSLVIEAGRITRVADVVLHSGNLLTGRAVDLDGRPVSSCWIRAMGRRYLASRGIDANAADFEPPTSWSDPEIASVESDGLLVAQSETATDGTFCIVGLARDVFRVWCDGAPSLLVPSGRTELRLVVQRTRLRVLAVDGAGLPVPSQTLLLARAVRTQGRPEATVPRQRVTDEHGVAAFDVEPFTDYLLQAAPPRHARRSVSIAASARAFDPLRLVVERPAPATLVFRVDRSTGANGGTEASPLAYDFDVCVRELPSAAVVFRSARKPALDGLAVPLAPGSYAVSVRPWLRSRVDPAQQARRLQAIRERCEGRGELVGSWEEVAWNASFGVDAFPLADCDRRLSVGAGERIELPVALQEGWPLLLELPFAPDEPPSEMLDWIRLGEPFAAFVEPGLRHIATLRRADGSRLGVYLTNRSLVPGRYAWQLAHGEGLVVRAVVESGPFAVAAVDRR